MNTVLGSFFTLLFVITVPPIDNPTITTHSTDLLRKGLN